MLAIGIAVIAVACGSSDQTETSSEPAETDSVAAEVVEISGPAAPEFDLPSANTSEQISLAQYRDDKPVVLVFYRAYW